MHMGILLFNFNNPQEKEIVEELTRKMLANGYVPYVPEAITNCLLGEESSDDILISNALLNSDFIIMAPNYKKEKLVLEIAEEMNIPTVVYDKESEKEIDFFLSEIGPATDEYNETLIRSLGGNV